MAELPLKPLPPQSPAVQALNRDLLARTNHDNVSAVRNTFIGGAAVSSAILVALTQVGTAALPLKIAVAASAISAPLWSCLAFVLELYLHFGKDSFEHLAQLRKSRSYLGVMLVASCSMYVALSGVIYFLLPVALIVWVIASVVGAAFTVTMYARFIVWWATRQP